MSDETTERVFKALATIAVFLGILAVCVVCVGLSSLVWAVQP